MIKDILQTSISQNKVIDYVICFAIIIIGFFFIYFLKKTIVKTVKNFVKKTKTKADDFLINILTKIFTPLVYYGFLYLGTRSLVLHKSLNKAIDVVGVILVTISIIRFCVACVDFFMKNFWLKKETYKVRQATLKGLLPAVKVVIWGLGLVFLLDNLGFQIKTVIAGLGIGGVAIALASQTILADLFCYFAILLDKPFEIGDFIIINDFLGAVEHIGLKTTRIRSLGGEQLVFSNSDLTNTRLRNYKRMEQRRILFKFGVTYDTTAGQLENIPQIVKNIIESIDKTVFDRAHFSQFADYSLVYEVVYYVMSSDYNVYMDVQQEINFALKRKFEDKGIEFAFPTQTVYINKQT